MMDVTIIICTFNRSNILDICLASLCEAISTYPLVNILVVDNNSTDNTRQIVNQFSQDYKIKYILEKKQGLSYARNKGALLAGTEWLIYLDDDTRINEYNISQINFTISNYNFDLFTGIWKAWHLQTPPKWLPESTGNYTLKGSRMIREIGSDYVTGLIMIIRKNVLEEIGYFPTHLGMRGDTVAYGEESYVEMKLKERGFFVGINPFLEVEHLVGLHKYRLIWHLKAAYAKGKADNLLIGHSVFITIIQLIGSILIGLFKPLTKFCFRKEYYYQNVLIDYIGGILFYIGRLNGL